MLRNSKERWGGVQIGLHWLIAALILLVQLPAGFVMVELDPGTLQNVLYTLHKNVGVIVFLLAVLRLVWRWVWPVPAMPTGMPRWQASAANAAHVAMYVLILLLPITGYLYTAMGGFPVPFLLMWELSGLAPVNKPVAAVLGAVHDALPWALLAVVLVHVVAALEHQFLRRDGILTRMLSSTAPLPPRS